MAAATREKPITPSPEPLAGNVGWLLSRASWAINTELTAKLADLGVGPRGFCVLATAMESDLTQTEIAQAVGVDKTTMVVTLDELEAAGLAKRLPSPHDRRARIVSVTKAGRRKVAEGHEIVARVQDDVLAGLPPAERALFVDTLCQLVTERLAQPVECSPPVRRREPRG